VQGCHLIEGEGAVTVRVGNGEHDLHHRPVHRHHWHPAHHTGLHHAPTHHAGHHAALALLTRTAHHARHRCLGLRLSRLRMMAVVLIARRSLLAECRKRHQASTQ
jgi:hypothetical protein